MIIDGALQLSGTAGNAAAMTDSPTTGTQQSTNIIDLVAARDMGIGDDPALKFSCQIMTTFTGGTSLEVQFQGAPDNAGVPGTWTTYATSGAVAEANLLAGRYILAIDLPRPAPGSSIPRFLRAQYVTVGTHGAGALIALIVLDRQENISYPAGITISN